MRHSSIAIFAAASGAVAQSGVPVAQIFAGVSKVFVGIGAARLDNSTEGKCHQLAMFGQIMDTVQEPQIASLLQVIDTVGAAVKVKTDAIAPILESLKADQQLVQNCQETVTKDRQVHDCLIRQMFAVANRPDVQERIQQLPNADKVAEDIKKGEAAFSGRLQAIEQDPAKQQFCKENADSRCTMIRIVNQAVKMSTDKEQMTQKLFNSEKLANAFTTRVAAAKERLDKSTADTPDLPQICERMPKVLPVDIEAVTWADVQLPNITQSLQGLRDRLRQGNTRSRIEGRHAI